MKNEKSMIKYLVFLFILFGCSSSTKKTDFMNEKFEDFFAKFSIEESFQLSRITFPIKYVSFDITDELTESNIEKLDWKFTDFSNDSAAADRDSDAYEVIVDQSSNGEVIYTRTGIDNGIRIHYHFQLKNSKWFLSKIIDKSS